MEPDVLYDTVFEAVREALTDYHGSPELSIARRMSGGRVIFEDGQGRLVKDIPVMALFKKITAIREKLRVLEQKVNNNDGLGVEDKAEMQAYITRAYGSMTTFNFLFEDEDDKFKGTGT